ncbi:MAG: hypothetical protein K0B06_06350 [Brevefilum sp.]|nr:hypothetical protein [Brevefilum sp.]
MASKFDLHRHWTRLTGNRANKATLLTGLVLLSVFALFMGLTQFSTPNLPGNDGFYHIKMAYLMRTEGLKPNFPWLPLTILNAREFYNHHFLFHVLLIPFTFGDLLIGAKLSAVVFSVVAFWLVWRLIDRQKVPYAAVWALGLVAVSEAFIFRMSIPRAQSLSLGVLALGLDWLLSGKHKRLFFLGFIYVWLYNAFPLLLVVAGAYTLAVWLIDKRLDLWPLLFSGLGIAAGLLINPYFPYNLAFIFQHILPKLVDTTGTNVGNEWFPYTTQQLLRNSPLTLALFASAVLALGLSKQRMSVNTATGFFLTIIFGLMLFQSRRFIEYFPAIVLIFTAFAWSPMMIEIKDKAHERSWTMTRIWQRKLVQNLALLVLVVIMLPMAWKTLVDSQSSLQSTKQNQLFQGASAWLVENTPAGARVFQTDWDDFPRLFFYNTHNTYLVGLDPTYMQFYDADLYAVWVDITRGRVENPSRIIEDNFGAEYILSDLSKRGFLGQAADDVRLQEVYRDAEAVIFQVIDL